MLKLQTKFFPYAIISAKHSSIKPQTALCCMVYEIRAIIFNFLVLMYV